MDKRLLKLFNKARINFPKVISQQIRKPTDHLVHSRMTIKMTRAATEIETALKLIGAPQFKTFDPLRIPSSGCEEWGEAICAVWIRFRNWHDSTVDTQARNACIMYIKGYNRTEIERECRIRKDGRVYPLIVASLEDYVRLNFKKRR